jgi:hypothetical protein
MAVIKLKAGETVLVAAVKPGQGPDQGLPVPPGPGKPDQGLPGGSGPVDPGYGIDAGLGWLRPTHPIAGPGVDNTLPIPLPPEGPVDPAWGIDADIGYVRPDNSLPVPQPPAGPKWEVKVGWTPLTGWIVVAVPTGEHVTPSKRK